MTIYLASSLRHPDIFPELSKLHHNFGGLVSYTERNKKGLNQLLSSVPVVLDSGAYSIFTKTSNHSIDEYIKYCVLIGHQYTWYAGLDVIGNPNQTFINLEYMESFGLKPVPTFHYGSEWKYLTQLLDKHNFIGIGGLVPLSRYPKKIYEFLSRCYAFIPKSYQCHIWGMSNKNILCQIPAYSYDSTSWLFAARMGYKYNNKINQGSWIRNDVTRARGYIDNRASNKLIAEQMIKLNYTITNLWASRGVKWD
jgi:hypothetical protein